MPSCQWREEQAQGREVLYLGGNTWWESAMLEHGTPCATASKLTLCLNGDCGHSEGDIGRKCVPDIIKIIKMSSLPGFLFQGAVQMRSGAAGTGLWGGRKLGLLLASVFTTTINFHYRGNEIQPRRPSAIPREGSVLLLWQETAL